MLVRESGMHRFSLVTEETFALTNYADRNPTLTV